MMAVCVRHCIHALGIKMTTEANCTFRVTAWDEKPYQEFEGGAKLTRAKVSQAFQDTISGEGLVEFLRSHSIEGTASFAGIDLVKRAVGDKSGRFVIQHVGTYDSGGAHSAWSIVPGSGTGDLRVLPAKMVTSLPVNPSRCLSPTIFQTMPNIAAKRDAQTAARPLVIR